jgi:hypothetical protein
MMKTSRIIFALIAIGLSTLSCSKSYKCQCFTSGNEYPIGEVSRSEADAVCETYEDDPFNGNCAVIEE